MKIARLYNKHILYSTKEKVIKTTFKEWFNEAKYNFYTKYNIPLYSFYELTKEQEDEIEIIKNKYKEVEEMEIVTYYLQWWITIKSEDYDEIKII